MNVLQSTVTFIMFLRSWSRCMNALLIRTNKTNIFQHQAKLLIRYLLYESKHSHQASEREKIERMQMVIDTRDLICNQQLEQTLAKRRPFSWRVAQNLMLVWTPHQNVCLSKPTIDTFQNLNGVFRVPRFNKTSRINRNSATDCHVRTFLATWTRS